MALPLARESLDLWELQGHTPAEQLQLALWRGELEVRAGNVDAAVGHFRRAIELDPAGREARLKLARILAHSDPDEALQQLQVLRQAQANDPDVLYLQALTQRNLGQLDAAASTLGELLARDPKHLDGLVLRGRVALDQRQLDEAGMWLAQAEKLAPLRHGVLLSMIDLLRRSGKHDEAERYQQRLDEVIRQLQRQFGQVPSTGSSGADRGPVAGPEIPAP
jgi:predicted Zn-dependent protease